MQKFAGNRSVRALGAATSARRPLKAAARAGAAQAQFGARHPAAARVAPSAIRAIVTASDALRVHLGGRRFTAPAAIDLARVGSELAELVRKYQAAVRQVVLAWHVDPTRDGWLVEASSGLTLDTLEPTAPAVSRPERQVLLAADQPLRGLRTRFCRTGVGIPLTLWAAPHEHGEVDDPGRTTAAQAMTAVVTVGGDLADPIRSVHVELLDPVTVHMVRIAGVALPLAADLTAPVARTLGSACTAATPAHAIRRGSHHGTVAGFSALTPHAPGRTPLVLLDAYGCSPLMLAQVANEIAGDVELSRRYQVWLYRIPMALPLLVASRLFRVDFDAFADRLDAAAGRQSARRAIIVAQGAAAIPATALLVEPGCRLWNAAFRTPLSSLQLSAADRALLQTLFFWQRSSRVGRVLVTGDLPLGGAMTRGVGERAVQLLLRLPVELRSAIERIYGRHKHELRGSGPDSDAGGSRFHPRPAACPEPIAQALADVIVACDRELLSMLSAAEKTGAGCARIATIGEQPVVAIQTAATDLSPSAVRHIVDSLRPAQSNPTAAWVARKQIVPGIRAARARVVSHIGR